MTTDCFQDNVKILQSIYPGIAQLIQSVAPKELTISDELIEQIFDKEADLHILYQAAGSPLLTKLDEKISLANLHDNRNRRLLLIEDRIEIFRWWIESNDIRSWLESERCLFLVHSSCESALQNLFKRYPEISVAPIQIHMGDPNLNQNRIDEIKFQFSDIQQRLTHTLTEYTTANQKPIPPYPKTIRLMAAGHNYLQDATCTALNAMGYDAKRLSWRDPLYRFIRHIAWIHAHRDAALDTALFINTTPDMFTHGTTFHDLNLRSISWFVDNPRRFANNEQQDFHNNDVIGVFDKTYIPYLKQHTNCPVIEVRTAYGIDESFGNPSLGLSNIDIAFVGELGAKNTQLFEQSYSKLNPAVVSLSNEIFSEMDINSIFSLDDTVPQRLNGIGDLPYQGNMVTYFENKAAYLRRKQVLDSIADQNLKIFGDSEWANPEWSGNAAKNYAGNRLDYFTELPRLYSTAKINLNIFHPQCIAAPNPRVYDVLACGGFLLSSYNPGLEDEFVIGEDLDVFHTPDELQEKIAYYLSHPDERKQIALNGKQKVLANCSYSDRMALFFSALSA